jgi:hypothetical protein
MERSDESKQWLLKDQERRLQHLDDWQKEYEQMNVTYSNLTKMVEECMAEQKRVDDRMTNLRYKIGAEERKVREINKMLRSKNDPSLYDPRDFTGDRSNI